MDVTDCRSVDFLKALAGVLCHDGLDDVLIRRTGKCGVQKDGIGSAVDNGDRQRFDKCKIEGLGIDRNDGSNLLKEARCHGML